MTDRETAVGCGAYVQMNGVLFNTNAELAAFAQRIRAEEREACAKKCDEIEERYRVREHLKYPENKTDAETGASDCAAAIRAAGEQP